MAVSYKEYTEEKRNFFIIHNYDFQTRTSQMDEYGRYHKEYVFSDDAVWYEEYSTEFVTAEVEVKKCKMNIEVKMFRTEYYSSDNASSRFYYEKY